MFTKGDEVVCIRNMNHFGNKINMLELNKIYIVENFIKLKERNYDWIVIKGSDDIFDSPNFLSIQQYRKLKILKLKEKICLESVKK